MNLQWLRKFKMRKLFSLMISALVLGTFPWLSLEAKLVPSGKEATLFTGENILAAGVWNDASLPRHNCIGCGACPRGRHFCDRACVFGPCRKNRDPDLTLIIKLMEDRLVLIDEGSEARYIEPKSNLPSDNDPIGWTRSDFDDSKWSIGVYGFGYGGGDDNTEVGSKASNTSSIYTRARFRVPNAFAIKTLTLGVDYDDTVVVWLNGIEIARSESRLPEKPRWNNWSSKPHEASKKNPPAYKTVEVKFVPENLSAISPLSKLTATWGAIKVVK